MFYLYTLENNCIFSPYVYVYGVSEIEMLVKHTHDHFPISMFTWVNQ